MATTKEMYQQMLTSHIQLTAIVEQLTDRLTALEARSVGWKPPTREYPTVTLQDIGRVFDRIATVNDKMDSMNDWRRRLDDAIHAFAQEYDELQHTKHL